MARRFHALPGVARILVGQIQAGKPFRRREIRDIDRQRAFEALARAGNVLFFQQDGAAQVVRQRILRLLFLERVNRRQRLGEITLPDVSGDQRKIRARRRVHGGDLFQFPERLCRRVLDDVYEAERGSVARVFRIECRGFLEITRGLTDVAVPHVDLARERQHVGVVADPVQCRLQCFQRLARFTDTKIGTHKLAASEQVGSALRQAP